MQPKYGTYFNNLGNRVTYKFDGDKVLRYKIGCALCSGWAALTEDDVKEMTNEEFDFVAKLVDSNTRSSRVRH
jgi:hypothetical protein